MGSYHVVDSRLQGMVDLKAEYESSIADAPGRLARIDSDMAGLHAMPEEGDIDAICDAMKRNYDTKRTRERLLLERVKISAEAQQYQSLLPDLKQSIEFYVAMNPHAIRRVSEPETTPAVERVIDITPPKYEKQEPLLEERVSIPAPPSSYVTAVFAEEKRAYLQFLEYRNLHSQKRLSTIVREAAVRGITSIADAYSALSTAMREGHTVCRYDNNLASDAMRDEMVRAYCTDYSKSLKAIAEDLSNRYHLHVSEATIRKYARDSLGDISRRDQSAERRYRKAIRSSQGLYSGRSRRVPYAFPVCAG